MRRNACFKNACVACFSLNCYLKSLTNARLANVFPFFPLCQHYLEPPLKLSEALERYGLKTEDFFVLKHGESRYLNTDEN